MKKLLFPVLACIILNATNIHSMFLKSLTQSQGRKNLTQKRTYCMEPSTQKLCKELIMTLKKQDEIITKLLHPEHKWKLMEYSEDHCRIERSQIILKREKSIQLFNKWEEETQSWYEREYPDY